MIDLWGHDISRIVWFCAAGKTFFPGAGLIVAALILYQSNKKVRIIFSNILLGTGIFMVVLSATPFPLLFYICWAVLVLFSIFTSRIIKSSISIMKRPFQFAAIGFCIAAILIEAPYRCNPVIPRGDFKRLYIIGDSVSAGIGGKNEQTWPKILKDEYGVDVIDLSIGGATVTSALKQARQVGLTDAIVLVEIGGNDLFAGTPYHLFEQNLSEILKKATDSGRRAVMLELPLRPFDIRYGRIQRKLAKRYGVILVPKQFLADIFAEKGATVDLVHLSAKGHKLMAEKIWSLLQNSLLNKDTTVSNSTL